MNLKIIVLLHNGKTKVTVIIFGVIKFDLIDKTNVDEPLKKFTRKTPPYRVLFEISKANFPYLKKILSVMKLHVDFNLEFGFSYPDETAISYGLINFLVYNIGDFLEMYFEKYTGNYSIVPDFKKKILNFKLKSEIKLRPVYIIRPGIKMLLIYLKYIKLYKKEGGDLNGRTSNRRFNENYNG
jgi:hypothetical protein